MSPSKPRARTERRRIERELRRGVRQRERQAAELPGGAPDRPAVVSSAAMVEPHARAQRCPQCGGELDLRRHAAMAGEGMDVRQVELVCKLCHTPRTFWVRIERVLPS